MMWFLLFLLYTAHVELVIVQGENRLILKNGNNPCEGYIEIYRNEELGFVGDQYWSENTEKVVCRSTHCGIPVDRSAETMTRTISKVWLNELNCTGNENHLWECHFPGWSVSFYQRGHLKKITCSNKIKISLDGPECAGAVQYSIDDGENISGYICADGWGQTEADVLCKSLNCGKAKEIPQEEWMVWEKFKNSKKMMTKCSGIKNVDNLWQCVTQESPLCRKPASVICEGYDRLQLKGNTSNVCSGQLEKKEIDNWKPVKTNNIHADVWCQQMYCGTSASHRPYDNGIQLNCTDNVKVVLMDENEPSSCYGTVYIEVNGSSQPVCASTWKKEDAEVVCRELNCGSVIRQEGKRSAALGIMDNVKCLGSESSLWHCRAKRDKNLFRCPRTAYVVCAESMKVRLTDGPGTCAGRVEVQDEGQWKRVYEEGWTSANSDVVCRQLKCGDEKKPTNPEKFSQGSREFLAKTVQCKKKGNHISECIKGNLNNLPKKTEAKGITCQEHKVVFLKGEGDQSCSGTVGIEYDKKTYWLSGSKETWTNETANTVCREMHCGEAKGFNFTSSADMMKNVWDESYSCSSNTTSLFDCEKRTLPIDHNDTIATVTCSENIEMNLANRCWGNVNVCVGGKCGGVCADAWTPQKSEMLCQNLGCGDTALTAISMPKESEVIFKSLHTTQETTNLTQCNFIRNDEKDNNCNPAYVVCSGSVKTKLKSFRDKCSGNVEVYYDGQWLPVCTNALDIKTQNIICGELNCGKAGGQIQYFGPESEGDHIISEIKCLNGNETLAACNIKTNEKRSCSPGGLQCSSWSKVQLTAANKACSGVVSVLSKEKKSAVSIKGWTETEGNRLCQDLKCGNFKSNRTTTPAFPSTTSFSCADVENPTNIWACQKQTSPSQKEQQEQLFIECQDEPDVTLSEGCHGELRINDIEVCGSHWDKKYSKLVCQQLNCRNAIGGFGVNEQRPDKKYHHLSCEDNHYELGQCKRFKGKCDEKLISVYCADNVIFNTTEYCGGQIEVNYRDKWEKVCPLTSFPKTFKEILCKQLGCGGHNGSIEIPNNDNTQVSLETTLSCTSNNLDIKYCVQHQSCERVKPAEIYCNKYVVKSKDPPPSNSTPILPFILGAGFLLVLVILVVVFIRIFIVKKAKNAMNVSSRMLSRKEVEFESGDYEDVTSKANEMEDLSRSRFRSESEVIRENEAQSISSYDDIDGMAEKLPLNSQAATAGTSGDNCIRDGALDQDGVTYEVDDPKENYDDIEAAPEITETEAEVHESPQTTPESDAAPPPELVLGDDDYLVPGQDG